MSAFPITEDLESALSHARRSRPDGSGVIRHTFRIETGENSGGHEFLTHLIDEGWQLQANPVVVAAADDLPCHVILSMLRVDPDPRPLRIRGELRLHGDAELRGEISPRH